MLIDDILPRHGHRTPAELADDEILAALRGDGMVNPNAKRCRPDRYERVTLHSSRLLPVKKADIVRCRAEVTSQFEQHPQQNAMQPERQ